MSNKNFVAYGDAETVLTEFASDIKEKESTFRFSTMPTPSAEYADGKPYQYIGATTQDYTNGYFYKCVAQGTDPETYAWEEAKVQSDPSVNGITSTNIDSINVEFNNDYSIKRVYAVIDDGFEIKPFASATDAEIQETLKRYYAGDITLSQIQEVWSIGDTRNISMSAMSAPTDLWDAYDAQTVSFRIVDMNYYDLATPINGKTKALLALHSTNQINIADPTNVNNAVMETSNTTASYWENCTRRTWLRDTFYNALPSTTKTMIKQITHPVYEQYVGGTDKVANVVETIFLPTGGEMNCKVLDSALYTITGEIETGLAYYSTRDRRKKSRVIGEATGTRGYYLSTCYGSQYSGRRYGVIDTNGAYTNTNANHGQTATSDGQTPMFCI